MLRTLLLVLCVYVCAITCAFPREPQKTCSRPNVIMKIQRGGSRGDLFKVHIRGRLGLEVTHGSYANVDLQAGIFRIPRLRAEACDFLERYGIGCPLQKGLTDRKAMIRFNQYLPPGAISGTMDLYTKDGRFIACVRIETV